MKAKITVYDVNDDIVGQPWEIEVTGQRESDPRFSKGMANILLEVAKDPHGLLDYGVLVEVHALDVWYPKPRRGDV